MGAGDYIKIKTQERTRVGQLSQSPEELRFHWVDSLESKTIEILRFARVVFGLTQSSFILEGTLKKHFQNYRESFKELIKIIETDLYVDDLVTRGNNLEEVNEIKQNSVQLFKKGGFKLHKWNSNVPAELESENSNQSELTYAKQVLNQGRNETKILARPGMEQAK